MIRGITVSSAPSSPFPAWVVFDDVDSSVLASEDAAYDPVPSSHAIARGEAWRRYMKRWIRPVTCESHAGMHRTDTGALAFGG